MSDSEQEIYHRPSLDDNEGDNDEESEEEEGSNRNTRHMDDDEEEEEEIIEPTDNELLREIEKDKKLYAEQKALFEQTKLAMLKNGSLSENDTYTFELNGTFNASAGSSYQIPGVNLEADPNAQLTTFQENIITTGSGASVVLLVILCIMFIVQLFRKLYEYYRDSRIESEIETPLDSAIAQRAEDHTMEATAYVVYDTRLVFFFIVCFFNYPCANNNKQKLLPRVVVFFFMLVNGFN